MSNINLQVRAPGANTPEDFVINLDLTSSEGIQIFIQQKWSGLIQNQQNARLVISPTNKRNGSVIAPATTFRNIAFNPKKDILELWRNPLLVDVGIYFRDNGQDIIRERKKIPFDFATPLFHMIPTLQRVLELDTEFSIHYANFDELGKITSSKWLHTQFSLQYQDASPLGCLLCYPISKVQKDSDLVASCTDRGTLLKQSFKKDHKSSKQRRFFSMTESFLFYFKKEKDPIPAGVIPLEYYVIQKKLSKKKFNMILELSVPINDTFKSLAISYKLQADSQEQLNYWFDRIRKKCVNSGDKKVFGIDLQEIVARKKNDDKYIPKIVKECVAFLQENAIKQEGIFRISPSASIIELAKGKYDSGEDIAIESYDHNVAAGLLKLYFRELPEPLLTYNLYDKFVSLGQFSIGEYVNRLPDIVAELPPENYATSKYLFLFLNAVAACSDINKMTETNLAVVFGPNLLRSRNDMIQDCNIINNVTEILIKEAKEVFKGAERCNPNLAMIRKQTNRTTRKGPIHPGNLARQVTPFPPPSGSAPPVPALVSQAQKLKPIARPNNNNNNNINNNNASNPRLDVIAREIKEEHDAMMRLSALINSANERLTHLELLTSKSG